MLRSSSAPTKIYLTKSLFQKGIECSRKLLYNAILQRQRNRTPSDASTSIVLHPPRETSSFFQHLAADGQRIGRYAQVVYDSANSGVLVASKDTETAVRETKQLFHQQPANASSTESTTTTLFEAAIAWKHCLVRADILQKIVLPSASPTTKPITIKLVEVKAKSWDSASYYGDPLQQIMTKSGGIRSEFLSIVHDITFQKYVLSQALTEIFQADEEISIQCSLLLPDKAKVNTSVSGLYNMFPADSQTGDSPPIHPKDRERLLNAYGESLLTEVDVTELVRQTLLLPVDYPGSTNKKATFEEVILEWNDFMDRCNAKEHEDWLRSQYLSTDAPIGSHCRDCEFRNPESFEESRSGFSYCWSKVLTSENAAAKASQGSSVLCHENNVQDSPMVLDLYYGGKTIDSLIQRNKYRLSNITPQELGLDDQGLDPKKKKTYRGRSRKERQWLQVTSNAASPVRLDKEYLQEEFQEFQYPYHFIDFETIAPVLPFTVNKHPYQSIAFQFSHHILHDDGLVEHATEFLHARPGQCPNLDFLNALITCFDKDYQTGTIFRWGSHENTILRSIWADVEHYNSDSLLPSTMERFFGDAVGLRFPGMVDLMDIVSKGYYVHGSNASVSIKSLLLPTMRYSTVLRDLYEQPTYDSNNFTGMKWWHETEEGSGQPIDPYKLLKRDSSDIATSEDSSQGSVAHGGDAIAAYSTLQQVGLDLHARQEIESSLLRYCELDTLAMVMILQALGGFLANE
jgi:Domain of unknown function(DUF2779)